MVMITEMFGKDPSDKGYDVIDDLIHYMKNNSDFYRSHYYPSFAKMSDYHYSGKQVDQGKIVAPIIEIAKDSYCKKFDLGRSNDYFKDVDDNAIIQQLISGEKQNILNGDYR